ncbi:zinc finger protein 62 homolog [Agrilus planipennis]|uniref:Zinc finger protein 62 homolog n=1 Tax=Agrilus planipennis TaxID=224129 RepID=A0A1W4WCE4_AGRPL|nr:zinc finger protein 62 homolog [Agrilus planipennis]
MVGHYIYLCYPSSAILNANKVVVGCSIGVLSFIVVEIMGEVPARNTSRCTICLNESKVGSGSKQMNKKLRFCVPEKKWSSKVFICSVCISDMNVAYGFRKRCLDFSGNENREASLQTFSHSSHLKPFNCPKCSDTFRFQSQLFKHNLILHKTPCPFNCLFCKRCFRTYLSKVLHEQRHLSRWQFKYANYLELWQKLNFQIKYRKSIGQNIQRIVPVGCSKGDDMQQIRTDIKDQVDVDEPMVPTELEKIKTEVQTENLEIITHTTEAKVRRKRSRKKAINNSKTFQCVICKALFSSKSLVGRHVTNVHTAEKKYKCDHCDQKFTSMVYLNNHKLYHSRERPYICLFCGKGFITASDLYHHEKIHANKRAYKCDVCPKAFNNSSDLHKHRICVHLDRSLWKYECEMCSKRFPLKSNLDTHIKVHTGERNFACHFCEKKCISQSALRKHIGTHSTVKKFTCVVCGRHYKYEKSMKIHLKKAHDLGNIKVPLREKKYFCHMCPKSYFANNKLQIHIRTHTGEKPYSCELCKKSFVDGSYLKHHVRVFHNVSCAE